MDSLVCPFGKEDDADGRYDREAMLSLNMEGL